MDFHMFNTKRIKAVAVFQGRVHGVVYFEEVGENVKIYGYIAGLTPGAHGIHIHESGDLTDHDHGMNTCLHFNPFKTNHGCPGSQERHVGDLGNIFANGNGIAKISMMDDFIQLRGTLTNVIGRSLVVHANRDDCGLAHNEESIKNGNSGARLGSAVIGYAKMC